MKVFVAGHRGLVGSSILRKLKENNDYEIITKSRNELDLFNAEEVNKFFHDECFDWVFMAAAKVGGIMANNNFPVDFLLENLKIQNNIIEACYKSEVKKMLFLGSSCIYPKLAPQPMEESSLLISSLEPTNEPYSIAKIAGIKLCGAYNKQYQTNYLSVMPTNLYGPNDNYHRENAHALPMLLRRIHEAKIANRKYVEVWGTGEVRREFLYVDDLAEACIYLMQNKDVNEVGELVNIGTGEDCSILELAELIKKIVGYEGELRLDKTKPDGMPRKLLNVEKIKKLGWSYKVKLEDGIKMTYEDFLNNESLRL